MIESLHKIGAYKMYEEYKSCNKLLLFTLKRIMFKVLNLWEDFAREKDAI